jgi:hypothetical protein
MKMTIDRMKPDLATSLRLDRDAPRTARLHVARLGFPPPNLLEAVVLLTSELVTRAVRQRDRTADETVGLRAWMPSDVVRVELQASSELLFRPPEPKGPHYDHILLDQIADRWSIDTEKSLARIWFEIDRSTPDVRAPRREN